MTDTSNITYLNNVTKLDIPPDRILEQAVGKLQGVIVIGYMTDGTEYFASSYADGGTAMWLLERSKLRLLTVGIDDD